MRPKVFISYTSKDRKFAEKLASDLKNRGVEVWFDQWEMRIGDSLQEKIQKGIEESGWLAIVLTPESVSSSWVQVELKAAISRELEERRVIVLPLLVKECKIPLFLKDKLYADFRHNYTQGLGTLLKRLKWPTEDLFSSTETRSDFGIPITLREWPTFGGNFSRSGECPITLDVDNLRLIARIKFGETIVSSPTLSNDILYLASNDGCLYAFRLPELVLIWTFVSKNSDGSRIPISCTPTVVDGTLYIGSSQKLYAISCYDGSILWSLKLQHSLGYCSPAVIEDKVYFGTFDGIFYCVNTKNGEIFWTYDTNPPDLGFYHSPAVDKDLVFTGSFDKILYAFNRMNGELIWTFKTSDHIFGAPIIFEDFVGIGDSSGTFYCLEKNSGNEVWQYNTNSDSCRHYAYSNNLLILSSGDGKFYGFRLSPLEKRMLTEEIWEFPTGGRIGSSPVICKNVALCCSYDHKIYALDKDRGIKIWDFKTTGEIQASPLVSDNFVVVGSWDGYFYLFSAGKEHLEKPKEFVVSDQGLRLQETSQEISTKMAQTGKPERNDLKRHTTSLTNWDTFRGDSNGSKYQNLMGIEESKKRLVLAATDKGNLIALDKNGVLLWEKKLGSNILEYPLLSDDLIVVSTGDGETIALDFKGNILWNHKREAENSPILVNNVVISPQNSEVMGLDAFTGKEIWAFSRFNGHPSTPVHLGNNDIVFGAWACIYHVNLKEGISNWRIELPTQKWHKEEKIPNSILAPPVKFLPRQLDWVLAVVCTMNNEVVAISHEGEILWQTRFESDMVGPAVELNDKYFLVATKNGEFWKLDKNTGIKNKFYKIMHDNTFFENIIPDFIDKSPITTILEDIYAISSSKIYHIEDIKEYDWNSKEGEVLLVKEELKHKIMPFEDIVDSPAITTSENLLVVSRSDKKSKILCIDSLCIDSNQVLWEYNCSEKISYSPVVADY